MVLVHGILGQEVLYWNLMRRRLGEAGFSLHEVTLPKLALGDIDAATDTFTQRFGPLRDAATGPLDVLAHSAGGLVVRNHLKRTRGAGGIRRLMTLGTPHGGTAVVRLLPELGVIGQVRPDSEFLATLNADPATPGPTLYTAVWTRHDGVVVPGERARLPAAPNVENVEYQGITHWGYLFGPRVARIVGEELRRGFVGGDRIIERQA